MHVHSLIHLPKWRLCSHFSSAGYLQTAPYSSRWPSVNHS